MSSNEFGYIPQSPAQSFGNNKGIFTPNDIYDLTRAGKWSTIGQLEHLQTITVSNAVADFTSLQETTYNVHFFTFSDIHFGSQTEFDYRLSNDGGTTFETGYMFANQRGISDGSFDERKSTSQNSARLFGDIDGDSHSLGNGYMYLYNAGNSNKYTMTTSQMVFVNNADNPAMEFGAQLYNHAEPISAIRFGAGVSLGTMTSATISLYGVQEV